MPIKYQRTLLVVIYQSILLHEQSVGHDLPVLPFLQGECIGSSQIDVSVGPLIRKDRWVHEHQHWEK